MLAKVVALPLPLLLLPKAPSLLPQLLPREYSTTALLLLLLPLGESLDLDTFRSSLLLAPAAAAPAVGDAEAAFGLKCTFVMVPDSVLTSSTDPLDFSSSSRNTCCR